MVKNTFPIIYKDYSMPPQRKMYTKNFVRIPQRKLVLGALRILLDVSDEEIYSDKKCPSVSPDG